MALPLAVRTVCSLVRMRGESVQQCLLTDRYLPAERCGAGGVAALCFGTYPGLTGAPAAQSAAVKNRSHICISVNTIWM